MIIWFNCKITDQRLNPHTVVRYNLRNDNRFDIARYSFASFAPLESLVSKFIFNLELADEHQGREAEMEAWLRSIFPADKLILNWYRCNNIKQWREIKDIMDSIDDDLIFPAGNEDHIFLDSNIDLFKQGLELIKNDPDPRAVLSTSHYPESIRSSVAFQNEVVADGKFIVTYQVNNDALRVMKREYFEWYLDQVPDENALIYRTEHWNQWTIVKNKIYVATKEQCRHFDGYAHVSIGPDICPPLEIPLGFFNKDIKIHYGFTTRKNNYVNVNPCVDNLYTTDPENGTDYKYVLDELPAFWKSYISEIVQADVDTVAMRQAYDTHLLNMTRVEINWPHMGLKFDQSNWPPANWINNHTKEYLFYE
jgi:hypothetical protein